MRRRLLHPGHGNERRLSLRDLVRFVSKIEETDGCWLWRGHVDEKGYGQFKWRGRAWWAHRISYVNFKGRLKNGNEVDHTCRNPSCVRPLHLVQKSKSANSSDGAIYQSRCAAPF